jgi:hypothetical protein
MPSAMTVSPEAQRAEFHVEVTSLAVCPTR